MRESSEERELIISSLIQPIGSTDQFYDFNSNIIIDSQHSKHLELKSASLALHLPTIGPNNDVFTWTRTAVGQATFTVNLTQGNMTLQEIMLDLANAMSVADPIRNYTYVTVSNRINRISMVGAGTIDSVALTSFTSCLLFDFPLTAARWGTGSIDFYDYQDIIIPELVLTIHELTEKSEYKGCIANYLVDHITTLDLSGGHRIIHYDFEDPLTLGFWNMPRIPDKVRVTLNTYPGWPSLRSYYIGGVPPRNAFITLKFALINDK